MGEHSDAMTGVVVDEGRNIALHEKFFSSIGLTPNKFTKEVINGEVYYKLPYSLRTTLAARMKGYKVRSPIHYQYKWPGFTPLVHQSITAAFFTLHRRAYCLNGLGSGKTLAALWAADYLLSIGEISRVLVISPLSTLPDAWERTLFRMFPHLKMHVVHGAGKRALDKSHTSFAKTQIFLANHEFTRSPERGVFTQKDKLPIDLLIVDEGASYRALNTSKAKGLRALAKDVKYVWWMTATPTPNAPTDAWQQADIMGTRGGVSYGAFRDLTMRKLSMCAWTARPEAPEHVARILSPSICFKTDECIDLPGITYQTRVATMSQEQKAIYTTLSRDAFVALSNGATATALNEGIKANKLLQVACGILYTDDSEEAEVAAVEKVKIVEEILEEADTPVILFAPYKSVVRYLAEKFKKYSPGVIMGDVPLRERKKLFDAVQDGSCKLLIAHPKTMAHGITLTRSACIIWYAPVYSNELYEQANGRIYRQGQTKHCTIIHITSCAVEREIYYRLEHRQKMQGAVLEAVKTVANK